MPHGIKVKICCQHTAAQPDRARLQQAVAGVLREAGVVAAQVNVAIVDDATIAKLNERYLQHEGPTDVLSFLLEADPQRMEGDIVVSADMAARMAAELCWPAADELLLYAVHGALHFAGYDDQAPQAAREMRQAEARHLARFGLRLPGSAAPDGPSSSRPARPDTAGRGQRRRKPRRKGAT